MGQNGSGKSTLIKLLAAYHSADPGANAEMDGVPFEVGRTVPDGLRFVHQDLGLILELSAQDNLALHGGFARGFGGRVLWRQQEAETRRVLAAFDVDLDIHRPLAAATPGPADRRGDRRRAAGLGGRWRARARRAHRGAPPRRGRATLRGRRRSAPTRHERPVRLAPDGRDLRHRRPGHRPAWRAPCRHLRRRHARLARAREPDGRRRRRPRLPGDRGGSGRPAPDDRGSRDPRQVAARGRPRGPSGRDPRHRRSCRGRRARAAVRPRRQGR